MYVSTRIVRNSLLCSLVFASASAFSVIKIPVDTYAAINEAGKITEQGYRKITGTQTLNNQNAGNWTKFITGLKIIGTDIAAVAVWAAMPIELGDATLDAAGIKVIDKRIIGYPITGLAPACTNGTTCITWAEKLSGSINRRGGATTFGEAMEMIQGLMADRIGNLTTNGNELCDKNREITETSSSYTDNTNIAIAQKGRCATGARVWSYSVTYPKTGTTMTEQTYYTGELTEAQKNAGIDCTLPKNKIYSQCGWDSLTKSQKERILARIRTTSMGSIVAGSDDVFDDYIRGGAIAGGNKSSSTTEEDDTTRKTTTIDQTAVIPAEIPSIFKDINKDAGVIIPVTETTTTTTTTTDKATGTTSTKTGTVSNTYNINIYPTTHEGNTINNITNNNVISGAGLGGARTIDGAGEGTADVDLSKIEDAVTKIGADPADTPVPELELREWGEIEIPTPEATDDQIAEQARKIRKTVTAEKVIQKANELTEMHTFNYETFGNSSACPRPRKMQFLTVEFDLPFDMYCDYIKQIVMLMIGLIPLGIFIYFLKNLFIHG